MHRHLLVLALASLVGAAWANPPAPSWEFANTEETVRQLVQSVERDLERNSAAGQLGW